MYPYQQPITLQLTPKFSSLPISLLKGLGIFFDKAGETTPIVFSQFALKLIAVPDVMVFFHLRPLETPSVDPADRYTVSRLAIPNAYRLIARHGYMDEVVTPDLARLIHSLVRDFIIENSRERGVGAVQNAEVEAKDSTKDNVEEGQASSPQEPPRKEGSPDQFKDKMIAELTKLDEAYAIQSLYIIGKEQMRIKEGGSWTRKIVLKIFLWIRENTRSKIANLRVQADRIIEVGFIKDI